MTGGIASDESRRGLRQRSGRGARFSAWPALVIALGVVFLGLSAAVAPPAALAARTPPEIRKCTPVGQMPAGWTGDTVTVSYLPAKIGGKADPVDPTRCTVTIDGKLAAATVSNTPIGGGAFLTYTFPKVESGGDAIGLTVKLVTYGGQVASHHWTYTFNETKSPGLINWNIVKQWSGFIARGAFITVYLTLISMALACVFALLGALGRLSKKMTFRQAWDRYQSREYMVRMALGRIPYWAATFYTSLFRGTPLLLQIFVIYAAVPTLINYGRVRWGFFENIPYPSALVSGVAALSLNYGAYLAEVFRAGIQSVPQGQVEAAWAIGLSGWQTQRRIVLPQAFKIVIPAVGNDFIALIKDTSLVSVIGVMEVLKRAQLVGGRYYDFLTPLLIAAMVYWALTIFFSFWQAKLETRLARDKAREKEKGKAK